MGPDARFVPSACQRSATATRPRTASDWRGARLVALRSRFRGYAEHAQIGVHDESLALQQFAFVAQELPPAFHGSVQNRLGQPFQGIHSRVRASPISVNLFR